MGFTLGRYVSLSVLAAGAVVYHAFATRQYFYRSTIYLSSSKIAVAAMGNLAFALALVTNQLVIKLFLGSLRDIEQEMIRERLSSAVMESLLALTIFREEFSAFFVAMFASLVFIKVMHWLVQDRVDYVEVTPSISLLGHARIVAFMALLLAVDAAFLQYTIAGTIASSGQSVMLLFAFEYVILASTIVRYALKYGMSMADLAMDGNWTGKGTAVFYLELIADLLHLFVYSTFFAIVFMHYGLPLHLVRDLYSTFRNFRSRMHDFLRFRQVTARLDRFPDAGADDLRRCDGVCIICREEMAEAGSNKRLFCGHVFHLHCLRSWLERQQNCPTCRASVFRRPPPAAPAAGAAAAPQQQPAAVGAAADAHHAAAAAGAAAGAAGAAGDAAAAVHHPAEPHAAAAAGAAELRHRHHTPPAQSAAPATPAAMPAASATRAAATPAAAGSSAHGSGAGASGFPAAAAMAAAAAAAANSSAHAPAAAGGAAAGAAGAGAGHPAAPSVGSMAPAIKEILKLHYNSAQWLRAAASVYPARSPLQLAYVAEHNFMQARIRSLEAMAARYGAGGLPVTTGGGGLPVTTGPAVGAPGGGAPAADPYPTIPPPFAGGLGAATAVPPLGGAAGAGGASAYPPMWSAAAAATAAAAAPPPSAPMPAAAMMGLFNPMGFGGLPGAGGFGFPGAMFPPGLGAGGLGPLMMPNPLAPGGGGLMPHLVPVPMPAAAAAAAGGATDASSSSSTGASPSVAGVAVPLHHHQLAASAAAAAASAVAAAMFGGGMMPTGGGMVFVPARPQAQQQAAQPQQPAAQEQKPAAAAAAPAAEPVVPSDGGNGGVAASSGGAAAASPASASSVPSEPAAAAAGASTAAPATAQPEASPAEASAGQAAGAKVEEAAPPLAAAVSEAGQAAKPEAAAAVSPAEGGHTGAAGGAAEDGAAADEADADAEELRRLRLQRFVGPQ